MRTIILGDLLDHGPHSNATLTYARENSIKLIMGNMKRTLSTLMIKS